MALYSEVQCIMGNSHMPPCERTGVINIVAITRRVNWRRRTCLQLNITVLMCYHKYYSRKELDVCPASRGNNAVIV